MKKIKETLRAIKKLLETGSMNDAEKLASLIGVKILPTRKDWGDFPDVAIAETDESSFRKHPSYAAAKGGDIDAAYDLIMDYLHDGFLLKISQLTGALKPLILSVHAVEGVSTNVIPEVFAECLSVITGWPIDTKIVQLNRVGHTKSSGFHRLQTPALFGGDVEKGKNYLLVDDFVGQGGTLANLKGYIEDNGGKVLASVVMAGKPYSAKLRLDKETLESLRRKHGELEEEWRTVFGYGFDLLTESEARYLIRTEDADRIRSEVLAPTKARDS